MKTTLTILIVSITVFSCSLAPRLATKEELQDITQKGFLLYEYDQACWVASDSVAILKPDQKRLGQFLAYQKDTNWVVVFGRMAEDRSAFLIAYEATLAKNVSILSFADYTPAKHDTGWIFRASSAVSVSKADFGPKNIRYNYYVFGDTSKNFIVYFIPAQTNADENLLGGDIRYIISNDGTKILNATMLHKTVINMPRPKDASAGMHTHILIKTPVETDVFYVLSHRPVLPHYIISDVGIYVIDIDGAIKRTE